MTRPLAVTGFTMLFTLFVLNTQNNKAIGAVAIAALIAFVVFTAVRATRRDRTLPVAALSVLVAAVLLFANNLLYFTQAQQLEGKTVEISGALCELPYENNDRYYYIIQTDTVNRERSTMKIRLVSQTPLNFTPRDRITAQAKLFLLGTSDDDILRYYKSKGLFTGATVYDGFQLCKGEALNIRSHILLLRAGLTETILSVLPSDAGGLVTGLCLGDKTCVPRDIKTNFTVAGVSHLLAVSGLHLNVWCALLSGLLRKLRVPRRASALLLIGFIGFFAVLTGLNPPVLRAGAMLSMMFAGRLFKREADNINSIGAALVVMLIYNPYMAFSVCLWLSVLATLGLILWLKPLSEVLNRPIRSLKHGALSFIYRAVTSVLAISGSVTAATLPVYLTVLPSVSLLLVFSNLLMVTAGSLCMTAGGLGAGLLYIGVEAAGRPLLLFSGVIADGLIRLTSFVARFHRVLLPLNSNWSMLIFVGILVFFAAVLLFGIRKRKHIKAISITLALIFTAVNLSLFLITDSKLKLTVADVGNGTAVVLRYKGRTAVIGCGGNYFAGAAVCDIISAYASSRVDYLILPSDDSEAVSGTQLLAETYAVDAVVAASVQALPVSLRQAVLPAAQTEVVFPDGKLKIRVQSGEVQAVQILFGSFRAVISFTPQQQLDGAQGNLLICRKALPRGTNYNAFDITVLSTDNETAKNPFAYQNILLTVQNGDIAFVIDEDAKMQYWRT